MKFLLFTLALSAISHLPSSAGEAGPPIFPNGITDGAYRLDLGASQSVASATSWSYAQTRVRVKQDIQVFGSNHPTDPGWNVEDTTRFTPLGTASTTDREHDTYAAVSIRPEEGNTLGTFRWIIWKVAPVSGAAENTAFQELRVTLADSLGRGRSPRPIRGERDAPP